MDDAGAEQQRHFSGLNTRLLFTHVKTRLGDLGVQTLLSGADETRSLDVLLDDTSWSSYAQFRRLLEVAEQLLKDEGGLEKVAEAHDVGTGSAPEIAAALLKFGSPVAMVLATANVGANMYPILAAEREAVGPTCLRWRMRLIDGYEPFPELCTFFKGLAPQIIRLFGLRLLDVLEMSCQCNGDDQCVIEAHWDETEDLTVQRDLMRTRVEIAESRLTALQETVSDIVSTEDLDAVLARIVRSAARSIQAPGFILSLDAGPDGTRLYTDGVTVEEAERLLDANTEFLSAEVASTHLHYGRLVVVAPMRSVSHQQSALDAYARLAATALDSAFALEQARRQAQTAEALLQLSTSLAELTSVDELAAKVARAIPAVIDCDSSAVLLISDGIARVAAHYGYAAGTTAELDDLAIPMSQLDADSLSRHSRDHMTPFGQQLMDAAGFKAMAAAPLNIDGATIGLLVAAVRHDSERILDDAKLADRFAGLAGQATVALRNSQLLHQIRHQSLHDHLTDLANRALILDRADQMLARTRREGTDAAALFIDLDGFKEINDTLGHEAGDQLLRQVAERLQLAIRANDTAGRLGGDEFVVLVDCGVTGTELEILARRLLESIREPFCVPGPERSLMISASIGIAVGDRSSAGQLLRDADIALYSAKSAGKDCYRIFNATMHAQAQLRAELVEGLRCPSRADFDATHDVPVDSEHRVLRGARLREAH